MKNNLFTILALSLILFITSSCQDAQQPVNRSGTQTPVDYVNPYLGNISHMLVPTFPTIQLPNSMLRVFPQRADYTSDLIRGLPVVVPLHRSSTVFQISPTQQTTLQNVMQYTYDNEKVTPYNYSVYLDEENIQVDFAPSHQSAIYTFDFENASADKLLVINTNEGQLAYKDNAIEGYQRLSGMSVYIYLETEQKPESVGALSGNTPNYGTTSVEGNKQALVLKFKENKVNLRYAISYISTEQAKKNLQREIQTYDLQQLVSKGRDAWNEVLSKIEVEGGSDADKSVFYTSLYRTYERMISISEDGSYYSASDGRVHQDGGTPFYTDDWIWDTYRATHPLRVLIEPEMETDMLKSYILMAQQSPEGWMPTFPEVVGDTHRMNGNHIVVSLLDAYAKGLRGFDLEAAYNACRKVAMERSRLPWVKVPNTELDETYMTKGYFPALHEGEKETVKEVYGGEKRQAIAITLAACYDDWSLARIAKELGKTDDYNFFLKRSYNHRNVYNSETGFFHPKDKNGQFIEPFSYFYAGGLGARDYYDENNAWTYRWDLAHNPADLIHLMGSPQNFVKNLDQTFREPFNKAKWQVVGQLPDNTGLIGQFSMGNEPSLHIPYLYNYAGQPWKTQKRVREVVKYWFRDDLMGIPGDEDGGGLTAFVVFTALGFYPVTPGLPVYNIGSPLFTKSKIQLGDGVVFEIEAQNCPEDNKFIQSATLNGKEWNKPWFSHDDIKDGAKLVLVMGAKANKSWGSDLANVPPSAEPLVE